jgi:hypothetical protein
VLIFQLLYSNLNLNRGTLFCQSSPLRSKLIAVKLHSTLLWKFFLAWCSHTSLILRICRTQHYKVPFCQSSPLLDVPIHPYYWGLPKPNICWTFQLLCEKVQGESYLTKNICLYLSLFKKYIVGWAWNIWRGYDVPVCFLRNDNCTIILK